MRFTFLGTSAGEQYPGVFCRCENCERARALGGRNVRANSCAHLAPDCMIDFNNSAPLRALQFGVSLPAVEHLLITHPHGDHYAPGLLRLRRMKPGLSLPLSDEDRHGPDSISPRFCELPMLHVYGSEQVREGLRENGKDFDPQTLRLEMHSIGYYEEFAAGDMQCLSLKANHMPGAASPAMNYIIRRAGRTILYAMDTGWFFEETWERIRQFRYDLAVIEGTFGFGREDPKAHMNLAAVERAHALFRSHDLLKDGALFCVSHICPHWTPPHDEIAPVMAEKGITMAYDGFSVEL